MHAIAITAFGGPERLMLVDLPVPTCSPGQVVINVQAAGVGPWDVKVRQGRVTLEGQQFPLVLGDAVLDSVGGETAARSLEVVRDNGRLVTIVDLEQVTPTRHIDTHLLYFRPDGRQLAELAKLVDDGQITVRLDQVLPLEAAKQAHERLETRHHQGKVVLSVA